MPKYPTQPDFSAGRLTLIRVLGSPTRRLIGVGPTFPCEAHTDRMMWVSPAPCWMYDAQQEICLHVQPIQVPQMCENIN